MTQPVYQLRQEDAGRLSLRHSILQQTMARGIHRQQTKCCLRKERTRQLSLLGWGPVSKGRCHLPMINVFH